MLIHHEHCLVKCLHELYNVLMLFHPKSGGPAGSSSGEVMVLIVDVEMS